MTTDAEWIKHFEIKKRETEQLLAQAKELGFRLVEMKLGAGERDVTQEHRVRLEQVIAEYQKIIDMLKSNSL